MLYVQVFDSYDIGDANVKDSNSNADNLVQSSAKRLQLLNLSRVSA